MTAGEKVKVFYWDEEDNRVHRARGKCKSGVWYTMMVRASDYDALQQRAAQLEAALQQFRSAAKSWHDFHHGSETVQCDQFCELIPVADAALEGRS